MVMFKRGCVVLSLILTAACGGSNPSPSAPSTPTLSVIPPPARTPTPTFSLTGQVADSTTGAGIPGATVSIDDYLDLTKSTTTNGSGSYVFEGLRQEEFTIQVSATGYLVSSKSLTLTSNQTLSF